MDIGLVSANTSQLEEAAKPADLYTGSPVVIGPCRLLA